MNSKLPTPNKPRSDAQQRESAEPHERTQPMPLLAALVTIVMVLFGVAYLFFSEPFGNAELGDRRTVADLSAPPAGAAGIAGTKADGKALFASNCVACHQATGKGLPGVFPPLDGSEWVRSEDHVLVNILLHGISGEIEVSGSSYKGMMPSFKQLGDAEIAAVTSFIRGQWSNTGKPITAEQVAFERAKERRTTPFSGGPELKKLATTP